MKFLLKALRLFIFIQVPCTLFAQTINFEGPLLRAANLSKTGGEVDQFLGIQNALKTVKQELNFNSVLFKDSVIAYNNRFDAMVNFRNSVFRGEFFMHSKDSFQLDDTSNVFNQFLWMISDTFYKRAKWQGSVFNGPVSFLKTVFHDTADFTGSKFSNTADFTKVQFGPSTHFMYAQFGNVKFNHAKFGAFGFFCNMTLTGNSVFDFDNTVLPDTLDFSENSEIINKIDLTQADFSRLHPGKYIHIYLKNSDLFRITMDYDHFRILYIDPKIPHVKLSDKNIREIYEKLLASFKSNRPQSDIDSLQSAYDDYIYPSLSRPAQIWKTYSTSAGHVIGFSFVLYFVLSLINLPFYRRLNKEVYEITAVTAARRPQDHIYYGFVYTAIIFFSISLKLDQLHFKQKILTAWFFMIYTSGIACLFLLTHLILKG